MFVKLIDSYIYIYNSLVPQLSVYQNTFTKFFKINIISFGGILTTR